MGKGRRRKGGRGREQLHKINLKTDSTHETCVSSRQLESQHPGRGEHEMPPLV